MPTETPNYKFIKPNEEEFYDVKVTNRNLDSIDGELKRIADSVASGATQQDLDDLEALIGNLSGLETDVRTSIVAAINSLKAVIAAHLADTMPHRFIDNGKTYRWGFRTVNGEPQFIYEEVV